MKKITIFSFFNSSNIGDLLIAECAVNLFSKHYECYFCDISSGEKIDIPVWQNTCQALPDKMYAKDTTLLRILKGIVLKNNMIRDMASFRKANRSSVPQKIRENAANSDIVVFFGGNSVMDLNKLPSTMLVLYHSVAALKEAGKRVCFCAAGVGPFENKKARLLASKMINMTDGFSVRDDASYALAKELAPKKEIQILRDPVLTVKRENVSQERKKIIGVNVYFGPERKYFSKMKSAFYQAVFYLREHYSEYSVCLFSSEKNDISDCIAIKALFPNDDKVFVKQISTAEDLFETHDQVEFLIGTRMHTIITAMISHKPVLSISWQTKVSSLMSFFENENWNILMAEFMKNPVAFQTGIDSLIQSKNTIIEKNKNKISAIKKTYQKQIKQLIEGT